MDIRHPLAVWMDEHPEINQSQLAAAADCSEPHLSLVLQRKRRVSLRLAQRLSVATSGEIKVEEFVLEQVDQ